MKKQPPSRKQLSLLAAFAILLSPSTLPAGLGSASAQSDKAEKAEKARRPKSFGHRPESTSITPPGAARALTGPAKGRPSDIALGFFKQNRGRFGLEEADLAELKTTDEYTSAHNGVTHIYLRQQIGGIDVVGAEASANVAHDGRVLNLHSSFVRGRGRARDRREPALSAAEAVEAAARHVELTLTEPLEVAETQAAADRRTTFSGGGISAGPIKARLVYQTISDSEVRLAWSVEIEELGGEHAWDLRVDAETGEVLAGDDLVDHDNWGAGFAPDVERNRSLAARAARFGPARAALASPLATVNDGSAYNVFAFPLESPSDGGRTLVSNPADALASPFGWHDTNGVTGAEFTRTRGNNVHAYTDVDANNAPDLNSDPDGGPALQFDFPFNHDTMQPAAYRPAAVTNLFYWNNIVHDVFYQYGFNELSGNFQVNNYSRGHAVAPLGNNDDVRAEAQDGFDTNNANFFTPVDGQRPRMQMFVWNYPFSRAVTVNSPAGIAGSHPAATAAFGPAVNANLTGDITLADDANGPNTSDACQPLVGFPAGRIALLDRGSCDFVVKVKNAQNAGAVAVIVANNVAGDPVTMGGTDPTITIPSLMVSLNAGNLLKANLPVNATLGINPNPPPNRDSDFDAGVIAHEYGHGISNRLTGGRNVVNCLNNQEQMGEGWSDYIGLVLTTNPSDTAATARGIGTYVGFQSPTTGRGIRPTPYTTDMSVNPSTYDTAKTAAVPHGVGYVWATMLWEMYWNLVKVHGYNPNVYQPWNTGGNNLAIQLVTDGMKLQPCRPGFVDGRNAILQADQQLTGGENECLIWKAFAKRGLGASASQGSNLSRSDGTQAFDLPAACRAEIGAAPPALVESLTPDTQSSQNLSINNNSADEHAAALNWTITEAPSSCAAPADVAWLSASPLNGTTPARGSSSVSVSFDSTGQPIGPHTARLCIASDDADTPVLEVPVTLNVVYDFGFAGNLLAPPAFNTPNSGANVPVRFSLDGNHGLGIFAAGFPASRPVDCTTKAPAGPYQAADTPGAGALTYDPGTGLYHFNWKTAKSWQGTCREFTVRLNDGTDHSLYFNFTR